MKKIPSSPAFDSIKPCIHDHRATIFGFGFIRMIDDVINFDYFLRQIRWDEIRWKDTFIPSATQLSPKSHSFMQNIHLTEQHTL